MFVTFKTEPIVKEDYLLLSGIQHFAFCNRQWALIHIEQQWIENRLTIDGKHLHQIVDDPDKRGVECNKVIWRSLQLISHQLGFIGRADVVEFHKSAEGIILPGRSGRWLPFPIEYKRGKPKHDEIDEVQLCAQAICLEEMLDISIREGALFYGTTRRRVSVEFNSVLRDRVVELAREMHILFENGKTPEPVYKPQCKSCSLIDLCLPKAFDKTKSAKAYLKSGLL